MVLILAGCTEANPDFCAPDNFDECAGAYLKARGWEKVPDLAGLQVVPDMTMTPDMTPAADLVATPPPGGDGSFLLSVSTVVDPSKPIVFLASIDSTHGGAMVTLQELSTRDDNGNGMPDRAVVGSPLIAKATSLAEDGTISADFGAVVIAGQANPISGSDLIMTMRLTGRFGSHDRGCGALAGEMTSPFAANLIGSTWGAVRVARGAVGESLPAPEYACP